MNTEIPSMPTFTYRIKDRGKNGKGWVYYVRSAPGPELGWQWALPDVVRSYYRDRGATQWWAVRITWRPPVFGLKARAIVRTSRGDELVVLATPWEGVDAS